MKLFVRPRRRLRTRSRTATEAATEAATDPSDESRGGIAPAPVPAPVRLLVSVLAAGIALLAGPGAAFAQDVAVADMRPFSVTYAVGNDLVTAGDATLELKRDGDGWRYSLETEPSGVFRLTGKGRITETAHIVTVPGDEPGTLKLHPRRYAYRQDDESRRAVDATFDWNGGTLAWKRRGESETIDLDRPILDRLSVTLAVMSALRRGDDRVEVEVFDNGRIKDVVFEDQGAETLDTRMGKIDTRRVVRTNVDGSTRTTITWFAPALGYMPVKIEQLKRGELVARLTLRKLKSEAADIDEPLIEPKRELPVVDDEG